MNEIEKKIIMQKKVSFDLNKDKFMNNLHSRIKSSKTNRQICYIVSNGFCNIHPYYYSNWCSKLKE